MKYLLILLFLPSCVTIYVTEKPKLASHISDEHHCGEGIYKDAPKFNAAPAVISIMPIYEGIAEIADSATLTYPIWHTNKNYLCLTRFRLYHYQYFFMNEI